MTEEQKAAFIFSQSVCAIAEIESMKALNKYREKRGETIAYCDDDFIAVIEKYGIGHNAVLSHLK